MYSVKGFLNSLGVRSHVQPDTCLHCCPLVPSLLLHPCPECALLCMLCLPLLITCPAAGWHNFCDEFPSHGRRRRRTALHNLRPCGEGLPDLCLFHKLHSQETPVPQGHRELIVEECIPKRWSKSMISFNLTSK